MDVTRIHTEEEELSNKSFDEICGSIFRTVGIAYRPYHGYISLIVSILGVILNSFVILILRDKKLRSPFYSLLSALAIADSLVMLEYIAWCIHFYELFSIRNLEDIHTFSWACFNLFHAFFSQVFHTYSILLTLSLAFWRYIFLKTIRKRQFGRALSYFVIAGVFICSVILCIPMFVNIAIVKKNITIDIASENKTEYVVYTVDVSEKGQKNNQFLYKVSLVMYGVVVKLLPCIILTGLTIWLVRNLLESNKFKAQLSLDFTSTAHRSSGNALTRYGNRKKDCRTKLLIGINVIFLVTEFPQGIISLYSAIIGYRFFTDCHNQLGEIFDILGLFNSAVNFIVYCLMSRTFEEHASKLVSNIIYSCQFSRANSFDK
ncbi:G-protein coupled receptor dmsr-1-like [Artemia franciscana]|uniref:G-protein coupled receptor dmsr-1-like n=1 Tax=Artemia franciscana TaxID=6661 RepID=UPI0032D9D281